LTRAAVGDDGTDLEEEKASRLVVVRNVFMSTSGSTRSPWVRVEGLGVRLMRG